MAKTISRAMSSAARISIAEEFHHPLTDTSVHSCAGLIVERETTVDRVFLVEDIVQAVEEVINHIGVVLDVFENDVHRRLNLWAGCE
jgi:hypothetical protein